MAGRQDADAPRYPIESVDNALRLLLLLRSQETLSVSQAARLLGVAPSTAHRLLAMLQHHGFVQQDPTTRSYMAGLALVEVGLAALREANIRQEAGPAVEQLVEEVGETAHLVVLRGASILYVDCVEGRSALRAGSRVGALLPAHATAAGKALLAELPTERLQELLPEAELPALTERTITDRSRLLEELATVRARGYAFNDAESEPKLRAVAAVIRDRDGRARASITVAAPDYRLPKSAVPELGAAVIRAAEKAGQSLI